MNIRHKLIDGEVAMTTQDTEYSYTIPEGARNWELKLDDAAVAWRWSTVSGRVAGGDGHPMVAGSSITGGDVPSTKQTIYFACGSASKNMHYAAQVPLTR